MTGDGRFGFSVSTPANREIFARSWSPSTATQVFALSLVNNPAAVCFSATETLYVGSTCTVNITSRLRRVGNDNL